VFKFAIGTWAQARNRTIEKRSKRRSKINNLRGKWTWEQLGNRTRRKRGKTRIRADQKARRDNNLVIASPDCKTSTPGSNPGGASSSHFARWDPFRFPISLRARGRSANANAFWPHDFPPALACGRRRFCGRHVLGFHGRRFVVRFLRLGNSWEQLPFDCLDRQRVVQVARFYHLTRSRNRDYGCQ